MKRLLIVFFLITGCITNDNDFRKNASDIQFSDDMSFEEFKIKLEVYAINNPYPNIDD